jgi:competence protein ComEC
MKKFKFNFILLIILVFSLTLSGCDYDANYVEKDYDDKLVVHFIDVGQGDSTFIQFPNGETSLIDGGTRNNGEKVVKYLKNMGVNRVDYLIATHPHEDHIGGLPEIIKKLDIGKVYMPNRTANTLIFEELLKEIENKDLKINLAKGGNLIIDEGILKFIILAPNRDDYNKTNDFSIVTKIEYMDNSFIITGDAEKDSEMDILDKAYDLKANVLRVGHHGGRTSSNDEFLKAINPDYFVISVGADNTYGHPHKETLDRLNKINPNIMRTDQLGDIVIISDGKELIIPEKVNTENKIDMEDKVEIQYIGNKNTKVFHSENCGSLPKGENQVFFKSIEEAKKKGYRPHDKCIK